MKKYNVVLVICSIILLAGLCGCTGFGTETQPFSNINYESDVLPIENASIVQIKGSKQQVVGLEFQFRMRNTLDKKIDNIEFQIDFCDKDDNVLQSSPYEYLSPFPADYYERSPNIISFDGPNLDKFDHINMYLVNYEIME